MATLPAQRALLQRLLLLAGCLALPFSTGCQLTSADQVVRPPAQRGSGGSYGRDVGSADEPPRDAPYDEASGRDAGNAEEPARDVPNATANKDADSIDVGADVGPTDGLNLGTTDLGLIEEDCLESSEVDSADVSPLGSYDAALLDVESSDADSLDAAP